MTKHVTTKQDFRELSRKIRAMIRDGTEAGDIVAALSVIMIEAAMNIRRSHDQRTGSPAEIKDFLCTLITGQVDMIADGCPELFCVKDGVTPRPAGAT
jgi:hypothetical protein